MELPTFSTALLASHGAQLLAAFVLALPVAWEREHHTRMLGLRTFPLVAIASCAFIIVGSAIVGPDPDANSRLLAGLLTGIGFIGGGAILKSGGSVRGTATAASIWSTGVLGAAVGYRQYEVAVLLSTVTLATLLLAPIERWMGTSKPPREQD